MRTRDRRRRRSRRIWGLIRLVGRGRKGSVHAGDGPNSRTGTGTCSGRTDICNRTQCSSFSYRNGLHLISRRSHPRTWSSRHAPTHLRGSYGTGIRSWRSASRRRSRLLLSSAVDYSHYVIPSWSRFRFLSNGLASASTQTMLRRFTSTHFGKPSFFFCDR